MLIGTTVNALAIMAGALVGLLLRRLAGLPGEKSAAGQLTLGDRLQEIIMKGLSLCVFYIGVDGMLEGENTLVAILSMVIGAVIGELLDLDARMQGLGDWLQKKVSGLLKGSGTVNVSEGFVTSCLLFCVGAMAIVGALEDGLTGDHSTLFAKALLDGVGSILFASSLGVGVLFSAFAVFLYQGTIALLASFLTPLLAPEIITEMTCVGSILIVALSLNMLGLTRIKVMNLVPACLMPILLINITRLFS
ncbi:DUF554 domain-containing protein [Dysosmobacter acutus]|uniref:DUF554 domain-containing protein n=1 Tax=Dysosmobacter acutus TaxID=2841504 RepID=UPI0030B9FD63